MVLGERITVDNSADVVGDARKATTNLLTNRGVASVFLGDSAVTAAAGYELPAGESVVVELGGKDKLYAITAAGSVVVHALRT